MDAKWKERLRRIALHRIALTAAAVFVGIQPAFAQSWPSKPVRVLTSHPPGGTVDQLARIVAEDFSRTFGRPFVIEARVGANGDVAAEQLLAAPADGHTLLVSPHGPFVTNMFLRKQPFDHATAFAPVTVLAAAPLVLVAHPSVAAGNLTELLAWLRASPTPVPYASQGIGSSGHLGMELFARQAGFKAVHVPYKGTAGATVDLLGGNVQIMFDTATTGLNHVRAGKLKGIAVGEARRISAAPDLPAIAEALPGFEATPWYALTARAGTPNEIVERLAAQWARLAATPEVQARFGKVGVEVRSMAPAAFRQYIRAEFDKWRDIARASGAENQ
jgi:tripartite-type tricarboxylate transporter receptor subunit TctC